jgi:probable F420-dependent oxidoreductase
MRLGLTIPLSEPLVEHGVLLADLAAAGYSDYWSAETTGNDAFTPLVHASATLPEQRFGTAIASVYARSPALLAMQAAALAEAAPGRFILGIGASARSMVEGWHDRAYERPVERVEDTARFLRAALAGERITADFSSFSVSRFTLERPPEHAPPIAVAALGPKMLRVAGEVGDGVVLNWLGASDVPRVLEEVDDARAPRAAPPIVVARVLVCVSTARDEVRRAGRDLIARYLTVPGYANYQRWLGRTRELEVLWEQWSAGDRAGAAASIPNEVVDSLIVHGTPEECAKGIQEFVAAGVDIPVVKLLPFGGATDAAHAARSLALAVAATAP